MFAILQRIKPTHRIRKWKEVQKYSDSASSAATAFENSWKRCLELGVDPCGTNISTLLSGSDLVELRNQQTMIFDASEPVLGSLNNHFGNMAYAAFVCDSDGTILCLEGHGEVVDNFERANLAIVLPF